METKEEAEKAIEELNETQFLNKQLKVEKSKRSGPRNKTPGKYYGRKRRGS